MRWPSRARSLFLPACLGATLASLLAAAHLLSRLREAPSLSQMAELSIWMLVMAIAVLPVAFASAVCAGVACRSSVKPPTVYLILLAAGLSVSSVHIFHWYMTTLVPGVSWWLGSWRPAIAALAAIIFQVLACSRSGVAISR